MRHIAAFLFIGPMLAFGGCGASPGTFDLAAVQAGAQTAGKAVTAAACLVGGAAPVAGKVARRKVAGGGSLGGRSATQTIHTIAVASKAVCEGLGGIFNGDAVVPAASVVPTVPAT